MNREGTPEEMNSQPSAKKEPDGFEYHDIVPKNMRPLEDADVEGLEVKKPAKISYDFGDSDFAQQPNRPETPTSRAERRRQLEEEKAATKKHPPKKAAPSKQDTAHSLRYKPSTRQEKDRFADTDFQNPPPPSQTPPHSGSGGSGKKGGSSKKYTRILIVALVAVVLLTSAGFAIAKWGGRPSSATITPVPSGSPAPGAAAGSATPASSPSASALPSITPTPTPEPGGAIDIDTMLEGDLVKIANNSEIVVIGQFTEYKGIWNAARDRKDIQKEDTQNYIGEKQYTFHVLGVFQGSKIVKKDTDIIVTIPYESKMANWDEKEMEETFLEPVLNTDMLLFLKEDPDFDIWYADTDPWSFLLEGDNLIVRSYRETTKEKWNALYPNGIALNDFKRALGLN